ncbi:MAG: Na+/H+ antiporter NhaC family protein [Myxococcota bacterium]
MADPTWISLLPPALAIGLAITTRQVYLSLAGGIWFGTTLLAGGQPLTGLADAIERMVAVLGSPGDARVVLFTLVIGALITTIEVSGGVRGFVQWLEKRRWVRTSGHAQFLAWAIGVVIFIESNITVLVAGTVARPLFDRFKVSREKLAYVIDSTSAPICILIPLNAWGAYNLGLLEGLKVEDPLAVFIGSIGYNFYALAAVALAVVVIRWGVNLGPMKEAEARAAAGQLHRDGVAPLMEDSGDQLDPELTIEPRARNMLVPVFVMVAAMPLSLWVTGDGDLIKGSGSTSVLWAVLAGLATAWALLLGQRALSVERLTRRGLQGAGALLPLALILVLALALGGVARELGTGQYVAKLAAGRLDPMVLLPVMFAVGAGIAFSIGSSWGTFAIMLPIAIPTAQAMGLPLEPFVAASLAGGVFGDHASPISDTTIVASMAAGTDHIQHVRTQLPYALLAGGVAAVAFAILGLSI